MPNIDPKLWTPADADYEIEQLLIEIALSTAIGPLEIGPTIAALFGPASIRDLPQLQNIRNFAARNARLPLTVHELRRG